ncbi:unnamed protein product, partial [Polarella glacialis]
MMEDVLAAGPGLSTDAVMLGEEHLAEARFLAHGCWCAKVRQLQVTDQEAASVALAAAEVRCVEGGLAPSPSPTAAAGPGRRWPRRVCLGLGAAAAALLCCGSRGLSGAARLQGVAFTATLSGGSSGSRSPRVSRQGGAARPSRLRAVRGDRQQEEEFDEEEEEDQTIYYGGQRRPRQVEEDSEQMRIASRINQALAMRRAPKAAPIQLVETAWYDELGVEPSATQEDIRLRYLDHAADVEERLAYLLEEGGSYEEEMMQKDDDRDSIEDDEDW